MAKAKSRTVYLKKFFALHDKKQKTDFESFIEFDDDDWIEVVPLGFLPREVTEAVYEAYKKPEPWSDEDRAEQKRLRRERDNMALRGFHVSYERPLRTADGGEILWDAMPPDLENAISTAILYAFNTREDKLERVGEANASSEPSKGEAITVS